MCFTAPTYLELIEGELIQIAAIGTRHASCLRRFIGLFSEIPSNRAFLDVHNPIQLSDRTEPQPDVVLLKPPADYY